MMNFLEKLVYMILPNQIGFEGSGAFRVRERAMAGCARACVRDSRSCMVCTFCLPALLPAGGSAHQAAPAGEAARRPIRGAQGLLQRTEGERDGNVSSSY